MGNQVGPNAFKRLIPVLNVSDLIEPLVAVSDLIKGQVQARLVQAQELAQDARCIETAWERRDVDTLVELNVLDQEQATALREILAAV